MMSVFLVCMLLKDPYTMGGKEAMDIIWTEGCIDLDGPTSESQWLPGGLVIFSYRMQARKAKSSSARACDVNILKQFCPHSLPSSNSSESIRERVCNGKAFPPCSYLSFERRTLESTVLI